MFRIFFVLLLLLVLCDNALQQQQQSVADDDAAVLTAAQSIFSKFGFVGVAMINDAYVQLTKSWLCNTKAFRSHRFVLLLCSDSACFAKLREFRTEQDMDFKLLLVDFEAQHRQQALLGIRQLSSALSINDRSFWLWQSGRIHFINLLLDNYISILLFETDAVWFKCAFQVWLDELSRNLLLDVSGIQDGSARNFMGFGFLRIQGNYDM
jgi:hypothetical protein